MRVLVALALAAASSVAMVGPAAAQDQETPPVKVGAWTYRALTGDQGLTRYGFTKEKNHGESTLSVSEGSEETCDAPKDTNEILFAFSSDRDERYFKLEGEADSETQRTLKAFVLLGRQGKYEEPAKQLSLEFQDLDGQFYFSVNEKAALARSSLALCPTDPKGRPGSDCHEFSLDGFTKAYRFVCNWK